MGMAERPKKLKKKGITHVLSLLSEQDLYSKESSGFATESSETHPEMEDVRVRFICTRDRKGNDIVKHFKSVFSFIDNAIEGGGKVLVHCNKGQSRSVSIIIAYLMKKHDFSYDEALDRIQKKRGGCAYPNKAFRKQLKKYERKLDLKVTSQDDDDDDQDHTPELIIGGCSLTVFVLLLLYAVPNNAWE